jgi:nitrilase
VNGGVRGYDTPYGKISGLICFGNYMPLARYALYAWGTHIYIAATVARGEDWLATLRHIAIAGRVFVIGSALSSERAIFRIDMPSSKPTSRILMNGSTSATVRL